jgi:uncharacterized protein
VNLVDANVLLYAVNEDAQHHQSAKRWLDSALSGESSVGFAWSALLAFSRLSTKVGLFPSPLSVDRALEIVRAWTSAPGAIVLNPTPRHFDVLADLLTSIGTGGNLVTDAHLAALALEHRATIVTYDADFARFPGLRTERPI